MAVTPERGNYKADVISTKMSGYAIANPTYKFCSCVFVPFVDKTNSD